MTVTQITLNLASYKAQKQKQLVLLTDINMRLTVFASTFSYIYITTQIVK